MASRDGFRWVHLTALTLAVIMLPWSTAFLSIAQMLLAANWLAEGIVRKDLVGRFKRAFTSVPVLIFISFLGLNLLGLVWTQDMQWGLDLNRILLPVLVFAVVLGEAPPLDATELRAVLLLGAWSALASALVGHWLAPPDTDYRGMSKFISHIRLALLLAFAMVVFVHYGLRVAQVWWPAFLLGTVLSWHSIRLLGSLQAMALLAVIGMVMLWRIAGRWKSGLRMAVRALVLLLPIVGATWLAVTVRAHLKLPPADLDARAERTAGGELYDHDPRNPQTENGTYVWTYVAWGELERTWPLRSAIPLNGSDVKGGTLSGTLVRYLASKGQHKDSVTVMALSDVEVKEIERGVANAHRDDRSGLLSRSNEVLMELQRYAAFGDANGHSVTMRIEYAKAGLSIAGRNLLTGVGTGDTRPAFADQYERMHSTLRPEWRHRAHNEYLTLLISFGACGLVWALFSWWWPAWRLGAWRDPLFVAWAVLFLGSCFTDDTIETQAGATFFAMYYALLVFAAPGRLREAAPGA